MEVSEFEHDMVCLLFALKEFMSPKDYGEHFNFSSMFMTRGPYPDSSSMKKKPLYEYIEPSRITKLLEILKYRYKCFDFSEKPYFETAEEVIKASLKQKKLSQYNSEVELISAVKKLSEQRKYTFLFTEPYSIKHFDDVFKEFTTKISADSFAEHGNDTDIMFTANFNSGTGNFYVNDVLFHHCEIDSDSHTYLLNAFRTEDGKVVDCHVSRQTMQKLFRDLGMTKAVWSLFFKHYNGKVGEKFQEKDKKKLFTFRRKVTLGEIRRENLDIEAARAEIAKMKEKLTS